jgi:hypothetical protein
VFLPIGWNLAHAILAEDQPLTICLPHDPRVVILAQQRIPAAPRPGVQATVSTVRHEQRDRPQVQPDAPIARAGGSGYVNAQISQPTRSHGMTTRAIAKIAANP